MSEESKSSVPSILKPSLPYVIVYTLNSALWKSITELMLICRVLSLKYHWVERPFHNNFWFCQSCIDGQIIESPILMSGFKASPSASAIPKIVNRWLIHQIKQPILNLRILILLHEICFLFWSLHTLFILYHNDNMQQLANKQTYFRREKSVFVVSEFGVSYEQWKANLNHF